MQPAKYNIVIWVLGTWRKNFVYLTGGVGSEPQDLTGYTATLNIYIPGFTTPETPSYTMSTEDGGITLGGNLGTIDLFISDTDTGTFLDWVVPPNVLPQYVMYLRVPSILDEDPILTGTVTLTGTFQ